MPKIALVYGTRPEAIKMGPVAHELAMLRADVVICCTGQHTDLLRGSPAEKDLTNSTNLGIASDGSVPRFLTRATTEVERWLRKQAPDIVVVQGDTMSAMAGARAATNLDLALAHIEAGVRTHNLEEPYPEEMLRVEIDGLADRCYAPTEHARANLLEEGIPYGNIRVTGNTVVSAIKRYTKAKPLSEPEDLILITLHRRELRMRGKATQVIQALYDNIALYPNIAFLWPVHPAMAGYFPSTAFPPNLALSSPFPYRQAVERLATARGVITDSGGITEEAATLGVPTIILRNVNDRPEAVHAGVALLRPPSPAGVAEAIDALVRQTLPRVATNVFGNASAAKTVATLLAST